ncbi:MAG TPA: hypothetical protein VOB72_23165, partial [Candidatus Dormibacteraeota bacterium]|nr:hypothetical protein [Candidatus Dormibacteraeota bacterium]
MSRLRRAAAATLRTGVLAVAVVPLLLGSRVSWHPSVGDRLDGVSISGAETACVDGGALPPDAPTLLAALRTWPIKAVRMPLN